MSLLLIVICISFFIKLILSILLLIIDGSFSIFKMQCISCLGCTMLFSTKSKSWSLVVALLDGSIYDGSPVYLGLCNTIYSILSIKKQLLCFSDDDKIFLDDSSIFIVVVQKYLHSNSLKNLNQFFFNRK